MKNMKEVLKNNEDQSIKFIGYLFTFFKNNKNLKEVIFKITRKRIKIKNNWLNFIVISTLF